MSSPIKTNQLTYAFNKELFVKKYDVFQIENDKDYFKRGAYIIDAPLLNNDVCSVFFESGKKFFVLMKKNDTNHSRLKEVITKEEGGECITVQKVKDNSFKDRVVFQLLLNSLGNFDIPFLKFNNLTGHLYCYHTKWMSRKKINNANTIVKVPCLELKISPEFRLHMEVHTFTSELLRDQIEFTKKKFEQYAKYVLLANDTMRRKLKNDTKPCFIMRQTKNTKTHIPFLDIQNLEHFDRSKMGIITTVIENFNKKFENIAHLEFASITDYKALDYTSDEKNENKKAITDLLSKKTIRIVDCLDNENSKEICTTIANKLSAFLLSEYKLKANIDIGKKISKDHLNIRVIHQASYYSDGEDPHQVFEDVAVQHFTIEEFLKSIQSQKNCKNESEINSKIKAEFRAVMHEMLIKDDLAKQKITLWDWGKSKLKEDIDFGIEVTTDKGNTKYIFMTVHQDGTFNISEQTLNLFESEKYDQCAKIFEDANAKSEKIRGIIRDSSGNINVIKDTGWFTIPEIQNIKAELINENTKLRGKEKRDKLLSSCLDIKMFDINNSKYYFVGTIGNGMQSLIDSAANIRKIEPFENSKLLFDELLPLMNVTFVHNGQLTIVPFPFKYLREYVKK